MNATIFMLILGSCAIITSILTEAVKKFLDGMGEKYPSNIIVLILAILTGCGVTIVFYIQYGIPFSLLNCIYIVIMGIANWLSAMLGYDKVKQTIMQLVTLDSENK